MLTVNENLNPILGRGIQRISKALKDFSPAGITWAKPGQPADITFLHLISQDQIPLINEHTVVLQYCWKTAGAADWLSAWKKAKAVISYYDLPDQDQYNFLHTPLGYDPRIFKNYNLVRNNVVFATGHVSETEHLHDVFMACKLANTKMFHTGENFRWCNKNYRFFDYMGDGDLVKTLNTTKYVSCLRSVEGFELLGVEGLACGTRPIVLDLPCYDWYRKFSYTVSEKEDLVAQLWNLFKQPPAPVSVLEYEEVERLFSWKNIIPKWFEFLSSVNATEL